jgi:hypothetical protein
VCSSDLCVHILVGICYFIVSELSVELFEDDNSGKHLDHKFLLENGNWQILFASPVHRR